MNRAERLEAFAAFPERLRAAALAASKRPSPPGEWTAIEVVRHLIAVEDEVHVRRLRQVAETDDPHWSWTEPGLADGFDGVDLGGVLDAFVVARATTLRRYIALDEAGWTRHGTHATYGRLDVDGLLGLAVDHDAEHLRGLAETEHESGPSLD
jgi:hypothetical protein